MRCGARPRRRSPFSSPRVAIALVGLLLEAFFRSARLQSLQAFDAWAFWVPKAKALYFFGGLDEQVFTTSAGPDVPAARADRRRGRLPRHGKRGRRHAPPPVLVPRSSAASPRSPAVSAVASPPGSSGRLSSSSSSRRASASVCSPRRPTCSSIVLFVVAAVLLALWLEDGRGWRLAAVAVLLAGATLTKREGLLFAAIALGAAFVASWGGDGGPGRRSAPPRSSSSRRPSPGGSGTAHGPERRGACRRSASTRAPTARSTRSASRSRSSSTRRSGRSSRSCCSSPSRVRSSGEIVASRRTSPRRRRRVPRRGVGHLLVRRPPGHGERGTQPDRQVHGRDRRPRGRRDAASRSARPWRRAPTGATPVTHRTAVLVAAAIVAVPLLGYPALVAADGARFPSAGRLRPDRRAAGDEGGLDLVFGRRTHAGRGRGAARAGSGRRVRRRGRRRRRLRALEGALRGHRVVRAGLESRAEARGAGLEAELELEPRVMRVWRSRTRSRAALAASTLRRPRRPSSAESSARRQSASQSGRSSPTRLRRRHPRAAAVP